MNIWTKTFWKATGERAVKTAAQTAIPLIGANLTIININWWEVVGLVATAVILSVLTSIASNPIGTAGPGLGTAETTEEPEALYDEMPEDDESNDEPEPVEPE